LCLSMLLTCGRHLPTVLPTVKGPTVNPAATLKNRRSHPRPCNSDKNHKERNVSSAGPAVRTAERQGTFGRTRRTRGTPGGSRSGGCHAPPCAECISRRVSGCGVAIFPPCTLGDVGAPDEARDGGAPDEAIAVPEAHRHCDSRRAWLGGWNARGSNTVEQCASCVHDCVPEERWIPAEASPMPGTGERPGG
jgi:hypothetical protein